MVFIPRVNTVLNPIAHQGVVNTHVAVAEECIGWTWGCKEKNDKVSLVVKCFRVHKSQTGEAWAHYEHINAVAAETKKTLLCPSKLKRRRETKFTYDKTIKLSRQISGFSPSLFSCVLWLHFITPFSMSVALRVFLHTPCSMCVACKSHNVLSTYQRRLAQKSKTGIMKCTRRNFIVAVTHTQIPKINFSPSLLDPD